MPATGQTDKKNETTQSETRQGQTRQGQTRQGQTRQGASSTGSPRIALYYEHLFPESRGGGERLYGGLAQLWSRAGARVTYLTREHHPLQPPAQRDYEVVFIAPGEEVYGADGTRSPAGALKFTWDTYRSVRRRRDLDDCVVVSSTPALLVFAAQAGLGLRRNRGLIVDWLEVWTRAQWVDYLGTAPGLAAWLIQGMAVWATPTATCHAALVERRLRRIRPRLKILRSPGLIEAPADGQVAAAAAHPPYALFVGRLIADKNAHLVPAAVAEVRRSVPDFGCVIVGDGPQAERLRVAVAEQGLADVCELTSGLSQEELDSLMAGATCLLHPSQREGYGLVVVEAARHGTPVVVLAAPDNSAMELIEDGVNGFVAQTPDELAENILRCWERGADLRESTRAWFERARTEKSLERTAARILDHLAGSTRRPL